MSVLAPVEEPFRSICDQTLAVAEWTLITRPKIVQPRSPNNVPPVIPGGPWLTTGQFAERIGRSLPRVYDLMRKGRIETMTAIGGGRRWHLVHESQVARVLAERQPADLAKAA